MNRTEDELDLDSRRLCPDGACIGVVKVDGRCAVCGAFAGPDDDATGVVAHGVEETTEPLVGADLLDEELGDDRELCPDGACIGVIGPDGTCKECGAARP